MSTRSDKRVKTVPAIARTRARPATGNCKFGVTSPHCVRPELNALRGYAGVRSAASFAYALFC